jgi:hypothetical protein
MEELQAVRDAHDQMHADMQLHTESMRTEFRQFLEAIQGQARVAQSMHNDLIRMGETSRAEMDESRAKIEMLDTVLQELARRTQMLTFYYIFDELLWSKVVVMNNQKLFKQYDDDIIMARMIKNIPKTWSLFVLL